MYFSKSSVFMMSKKAWHKDKASFHQFHGQTLRHFLPENFCLALLGLCFTYEFSVLRSCLITPFSMYWGSQFCSSPYFIFPCHKLLNINHCGKNVL